MMSESQDDERVGLSTTEVRGHNWTHVLAEFGSADDLAVPLRGSARLRYTCMCVSRRYLALGANTGAVYIFGRESLKHLQVVLADKDSSPVNQMCFCPFDNLLAYSYSNGNIVAVQLNIERRGKPERIRLSVEHNSVTVTALKWDTTGSRLFAGDSLGKISVAFIPTKAKDIFQQPSEGIARLDSAIVQLDWSGDRLLVSTVTRCYLCYTARQQYAQIGKKLRDGQFGACFFPGQDGQTASIYCARPGSRIWEVDYNGTVLNTHQFKQLLAIPSFPVISPSCEDLTLPDRLQAGKPQALTFPRLFVTSDSFLLTWSTSGLYVLDPVAVRVITWTQHETGGMQVSCYKNEIYLFSATTGRVQKLQLLPVEKCVSSLIARDHLLLAGQMCAYFNGLLTHIQPSRHLSATALSNLYQNLLTSDLMELAEKVKVILDSFPTEMSDGDTAEVVRLDSGIYQVHDGKRQDSDDEGSQTSSSVQSLSRRSSSSSLQMFSAEPNHISMAKPKSPTQLANDTLPNRISLHDKKIGFSTSSSFEIKLDYESNTEIPENGAVFNGATVGSESDKHPEPPTVVQSYTDKRVSDLEQQNSKDSGVSEISLETSQASERQVSEQSISEHRMSETSPSSDRGVSEASIFDRRMSEISVRDFERLSETSHDESRRLSETSLDAAQRMAENRLDGRMNDVNENGGSLKRSESDFPRRGSLTSMSRVSSTDDAVFTDQVPTVQQESAKPKKKKRTAQPTILGPGEKPDTSVVFRRSISSGSSRRHGSRRRAKSDLGPAEAIREVLQEHERQETAPAKLITKTDQLSQSHMAPTLPVTTNQNPSRSSSPVVSQSFGAASERSVSPVPVRPASLHPPRSDSPIIDDDSPSQSPLVRSWDGTGMTGGLPGPKTALRSVKDSLTSKLSFTKKNLMRTLREKGSMLVSRDQWRQSREDLNVDEITVSKERVFIHAKQPDPKNDDESMDPPSEAMIDLSDLQRATRLAKTKLDNTANLLNPAPVLTQWLVTLHRTLHQLRQVQRDKIALSTERDQISATSINTTDGFTKTNRDGSGSTSGSFQTPDTTSNSNLTSIIRDSTTNSRDIDTDITLGSGTRDVTTDKHDNGRDFDVKNTQGAKETQNLSENPSDFEAADGESVHSLEQQRNLKLSSPVETEVFDEGGLTQMISRSTKDADSISVDSGHPIPEVHSDDQESDGELRVSAEIDTRPETPTAADMTIPGSSVSSGVSEGTQELPAADILSLQNSTDSITNFSETDFQTSDLRNSDADQLSEINWVNLCCVRDLLNAGQHLSKDIAYLANMSFSLGLHGKISSYINPDTPLVDDQAGETLNLDTPEAAQDTLSKSDRSVESPTVFDVGANNDDVSTEASADDLELAQFLRCYYSYLDPERVRTALASSTVHGYSTWLALVNCMREVVREDNVSAKLLENNLNGALDLLRSGMLANPSTVLGHLPRLFELSVTKTLAYCVEDVRHISPLDVLNVCRLVGKPLTDVFIPYMLARHAVMTQPGELGVLCGHRAVRLTWLRGLLTQTDVSLLKDGQHPRAGSHRHPWKHAAIINSILDQFMRQDSTAFLQLCQEYGYWRGTLAVLHHLGRRQDGLSMIVRLRDVQLLSSSAWNPVSLEEWQCVLDAMISLGVRPEDTEATGGGPRSGQVEGKEEGAQLALPGSVESRDASALTLTWDAVGLLLGRGVGAEKAIGMLQALPLPPDALSLQFYQALIVTTLGAKHQRSLLHTILERTDTYLWAKKPTQMAPQLHHAVEEERKMVAAGQEGKQTQVFKDMFTQLESQPDIVTHRFVEDLECHWGVHCHLNSECPGCGLSLSEPVSHSQPGVLVFHCGHGYHKFCQQDKVCVVCMDDLHLPGSDL